MKCEPYLYTPQKPLRAGIDFCNAGDYASLHVFLGDRVVLRAEINCIPGANASQDLLQARIGVRAVFIYASKRGASLHIFTRHIGLRAISLSTPSGLCEPIGYQQTSFPYASHFRLQPGHSCEPSSCDAQTRRPLRANSKPIPETHASHLTVAESQRIMRAEKSFNADLLREPGKPSEPKRENASQDSLKLVSVCEPLLFRSQRKQMRAELEYEEQWCLASRNCLNPESDCEPITCTPTEGCEPLPAPGTSKIASQRYSAQNGAKHAVRATMFQIPGVRCEP